MLKDADLYLFDEITSDLDSLTEANVVSAILDELHSSTVVFIAHRLATVTQCDRIHVLDRGRIVEQGTHRELLEANGLYASMWAAQHAESAPRAALESATATEFRYLD